MAFAFLITFVLQRWQEQDDEEEINNNNNNNNNNIIGWAIAADLTISPHQLADGTTVMRDSIFRVNSLVICASNHGEDEEMSNWM